MQLFQQNLLQALRNIRRTKIQTLVSLFGLVTGIVAMTLSANWLWTETNYEHFRPDYKHLYALTPAMSGSGGGMLPFSAPSWAAIDSIARNEGIEVAACGNSWQGAEFALPDSDKPNRKANFMRITPEWFRMMQPRLIAGDVDALFQAPDRMLVSRRMAVHFFSSPEAALGRSIYQQDEKKTYTIVGVYEDEPEETEFRNDCLTRLEIAPDQRHSNYTLFIRIYLHSRHPEADFQRLKASHDGLPSVEMWKLYKYVPLHLAQMQDNDETFLQNYLNPMAFAAISFILLLGGIVNILMVSISTFLGRTREYTLRRSLGASTAQNNAWILTDALPLMVLSVVFSAVVVEYLDYAGMAPGSPAFLYRTFGWVALGTVAALLLALLYPMGLMRRAYRLSFAGRSVSALTHSYLLVVQYFACALMLFISLGMKRQLHDVTSAGLGFKTDNILRLYTGPLNPLHMGLPSTIGEPHNFMGVAKDLPAAFRREVGAGITDAILMPFDIVNPTLEARFKMADEELYRKVIPHRGTDQFYKVFSENYVEKPSVRYVEIPFRAAEFFRMQVAEGAMFSPDGVPEGAMPALFNRALMEQLGETFPLRDHYYYGMNSAVSNGRWRSDDEFDHFELAPFHVQGVTDLSVNTALKDQHLYNNTAVPAVYVGVPEDHECYYIQHDAVYVKHQPGRRAEAEAAMRRILVQEFNVPEDKIYITPMQDYIESFYDEPLRFATLLSLITALSVFITFSGVLSLLLYSLRLRRRQMAIHRLMGAGFKDVLRTTLPPYLVFTLIGGVLAYAPAHIFMERWMSNFARGEVPGPGFMALIVAGMLLVVVLLTCWQVRKAMNEKPVEVLRPEA